MFKSKKIKILIILGFIISLFFIFFLTSHTASDELSFNSIGKTYGVNINKAVLEINGQKYESEISGQVSVYDFMNKLRREDKISFTEKNYTGIGKFIDTINGIKGNNDKNWIYYVNNKKAQVGVSNYKITTGDVVSWKYEKNIY